MSIVYYSFAGKMHMVGQTLNIVDVMTNSVKHSCVLFECLAETSKITEQT